MNAVPTTPATARRCGRGPVGFPAWAVAAPAAILPAARFYRRIRRRSPAGRRHSCGYDLTGNVSGMCPECGTRC